MIYEVKSYADDDGRRVTERLPLKQEKDMFTMPFYIGMVVIQTHAGNVPVPFEFPMGYTIEKCFEDFDKLAEEKIEEIKAAAKIMPASSMNNMPKIVKK